MPYQKNKDLKAKKIKIKPPIISNIAELNLLKKLPNQNPIVDIIKETKAITTTDKKSNELVNLRLAPATKASILVAIPNPNKHFISKQLIGFSFF